MAQLPASLCSALILSILKIWYVQISSTSLGLVRRRQWHPTPVLLPGKSHARRSLVGCSPWGREESDMTERLHFYALEKEMAPHSSVLAWRILGMGEPGGLLSKGSHRVGHDWGNLAAVEAASLYSRNSKGICTAFLCTAPQVLC